MDIGLVTEHLLSLIAKQLNDNGLVVWYDLDSAYTAALPELDLPDTEVLLEADRVENALKKAPESVTDRIEDYE